MINFFILFSRESLEVDLQKSNSLLHNRKTISGFKASDQVSRLNAGLHFLILINQGVHQSKASREFKTERTR